MTDCDNDIKYIRTGHRHDVGIHENLFNGMHLHTSNAFDWHVLVKAGWGRRDEVNKERFLISTKQKQSEFSPYVCPFVALLKATYAENSHIVLSSRYLKKKSFIVNLLCVLICFLER